jgi:hypothetical protein
MKYNLLFFLFLSLKAFSQSKSVIIQQQQARIDSLTEALEIQKEEFAAAERRFERNNEKMKLIDQQIISWHDQYVNPYHAIDYHMAMCPKSIKKDPEQLVEYIKEIAHTDLEKCRAVYTWIAYNIKYDDVAFNNKTYSYVDALEALKEQKAVCAGYSELFTYLCSQLHLEVKSVNGWSKGYGYKQEEMLNMKSIPDSDHAWNLVKLDGEWRCFDATWGSGSGVKLPNGMLKSVQEFDDKWFNCSPEEFIFSHYPESQDDLHLEKPITLKSFFNLPEVSMSAFSIGLLDAKETLDACLTKQENSFPEIFPVDTYVKIINAPKSGVLKAGETYSFEFYIPRASNMYSHNSNAMTKEFKESTDGSVFSCNVTPSIKGEFSIAVEYYNSKGIIVLLKYNVK